MWPGNTDRASKEIEVEMIELPGRNYVINPLKFKMRVGGLNAKIFGLGSWTLSNVHFLDIPASTLYKGNGKSASVKITELSNSLYRVIDPDSGLIYDFNADGFHIYTRSNLRAQIIQTNTYTSQNYIQSISDAFNNTISVQRDGFGKAISITSPKGKVSVLNIDSNNRLLSVQSPDLSTYTMTYHSSDALLASFEKPNGLISNFTYDASGLLVSDTKNTNWSKQFTIVNDGINNDVEMLDSQNELIFYNIQNSSPDNLVTSIQKPNWQTTTSTYTSTGTSIQSNYDFSSTTSTIADDPRFGDLYKRMNYSKTNLQGYYGSESYFTYSYTGSNIFDPDELIVSEVRDSKTWTQTFNGANNSLKIISPLNREMTYSLDANERVSNIQKPAQHLQTYTYNADSSLFKVAQSNREHKFYYNSAGNLSSEQNALGQSTLYTYDANGRVLSQERNLLYTAFEYDSLGNMTKLTTPNASVHMFNYNLDSQPSLYTPPVLFGTSTTQWFYNSSQKLTKVIRPDASEIDFHYSSTTFDIQSIESSNANDNYYYTTYYGMIYNALSPDAISNYLGYSAPLRSSDYMYLPNSSYVYSNFNYTESTKDLNRSMTDLSYNNHYISYLYDDDDLLIQAGDLQISRSPSSGQMTQTSIGNITETYSYTLFGEVSSYVVSYNSNPIFSISYTYNALGQILSKTEVSGSTTVYEYTYDNSSRLSQVKKNNQIISSNNYGANGSRLSGTQDSISYLATYDIQDRLQTWNANTYTYNANGEQIAKSNPSENISYNYDSYGFLKSVELNPTTTIAYLRDGLGRRAGRTVNGVVDRYYMYDNLNRVIARLDGSGNFLNIYVYASKSHVPDYMLSSGQTYKLVSDQLGSIRKVINSQSGQVIQSIEYDEWGIVKQDSNADFQDFYYAGGLYDVDTKLTHFKARDYDAQTGRWMSKDPILFNGGDTNLYGYVGSDPVNFVDPNGLARGDWWDLPANYSYAHQTGTQLKNQMPGWNDAGDAARHAEWNRLMAQNTNLFTAWTTGVGHEITGLINGQSLSEALMDLHNNSIGRNAGSSGSAVNPLDLVISPGGISKYNPYGSCGGQ